MANYTDDEMIARQNALANVRAGMSTADAWMSLQPKYVSQYAKPATQSQFAGQPRIVSQTSSKLLTARYDGRCATCGGRIMAGDTIRYDGKAHHESSEICLANEQARRDREDQDRADAFSLSIPAAPATLLQDGTWTLQYADGHHRTFKIHTQKTGTLAGKRIVKHLAKQDNMDENSYIGFAFYTERGIQVWNRFKGSDLATEALVLNDVEAANAAGKAYALASNCCYRCGHDLTDPISIQAGLGPDCRKALRA